MNTQPAGCAATHAPVCDSGSPTDLFFDNIESGSGNWIKGFTIGTNYWFVPQTSSNIGLAEPYATGGTGNIWGWDQPATSLTFLGMKNSVSLPANAFLHFEHSYGFESSSDCAFRYDGGVLDYSTDGGSSWTNAGALITHNGYNGTLYSGNPLTAIQAFTADSRGYISSRVDLVRWPVRTCASASALAPTARRRITAGSSIMCASTPAARRRSRRRPSVKSSPSNAAFLYITVLCQKPIDGIIVSVYNTKVTHETIKDADSRLSHYIRSGVS